MEDTAAFFSTYQEVRELSDRKKLPSFTTITWGGALLFWSMRWGTYHFFLKPGGGPVSLFEGWGGSTFLSSVCSLPSLEKAKEIVRIFSPQLERTEVSSSRLRDERSVVETEFPSFS